MMNISITYNLYIKFLHYCHVYIYWRVVAMFVLIFNFICNVCFLVCTVYKRPCSVPPRVQDTVVVDIKCVACLNDRVVRLSRIARRLGFKGLELKPQPGRKISSNIVNFTLYM